MTSEIVEIRHNCGHLHEIMVDWDDNEVFFMDTERCYQICPSCGSGISAREMFSDYHKGEIDI